MLAQHTDLDFDSGPQSRGLERLCVATRTVLPVESMIRFVIAPDGELVPDLKRKLPGRGVWVTANRGALEAAVKASAFARAFRRPLRVAADFADRTEHLLENAMLDALAIAGKAGLVVMGFTRIENALARGAVVALLHAADAALDGAAKLDAAARRSRRAGGVTVIRRLAAGQLDLALGRPIVIHAALLAGRASDTFMARLRRLERFRGGDLDEDFEVATAATADAYGTG
jgi:uncharacterized protein